MITPHQPALTVYEAGRISVVSFNPAVPAEAIDLPQLRAEILELVQLHNCQDIAFDVDGVEYIPSQVFGLLISLKKLGVNVQLYNPTQKVRELLKVTHLNTMFQIRDLAR